VKDRQPGIALSGRIISTNVTKDDKLVNAPAQQMWRLRDPTMVRELHCCASLIIQLLGSTILSSAGVVDCRGIWSPDPCMLSLVYFRFVVSKSTQAARFLYGQLLQDDNVHLIRSVLRMGSMPRLAQLTARGLGGRTEPRQGVPMDAKSFCRTNTSSNIMHS